MRCIATRIVSLAGIVTFAIIATILLYLPAWAGTWSDDFNDGSLDGWKTFDENRGLEKWTVKNGEVSAESFGTFAILYTGEANWKNYTLECKANPKSLGRLGSNSMGIWVRLQDHPKHSGYYMSLWMTPAGAAGYTIQSFGSGVKTQKSLDLANLGKLPKPELDTWYRLKAKVEGNKLSFYVNGMLALEAKDDTIKSGKVGLSVQGTSVQAHFDDVIVIGEGIDGGQRVESKSKLATSWGKIKFSTFSTLENMKKR